MPTLPMLKLSEVGQRLNLSVMTVRRLVDSGAIPSYRVGKSIRVAAGDLEAYLKAQRTKAKRSKAPGTNRGKGDQKNARQE